MNTAARLESTGQPGRIQVSQETADLLIAAGKETWLEERPDRVNAKGKGALKTFWLRHEQQPSESSRKLSSDTKISRFSATVPTNGFTEITKLERLVDWNIDVLARLLKQVVARRRSRGTESTELSSSSHYNPEPNEGSILSEVKEIIALPRFDPVAFKNEQNPESIELDEAVKEELHTYVSSIAAMYRANPFHNFEHASHVTMSVVKLLSRIVAPTDEIMDRECGGGKSGSDGGNSSQMASTMHDHTYGITSDPLTQFACVLSALIHDADHPGVPNAQLVKERNQLAILYNNQSVAEQNLVDLAWDLLMDDDFRNFRRAICSTPDEMKRFRQLVVNSVMATDIVDKELKALRNARWEKAFDTNTTSSFSRGSGGGAGNERDATNRKATIVIEHLIQASDVAHTMQHWHIYRKWNERFFMECYAAYKDGRAATNPADGWYKGELGFFDFYIIPLAKKLKDCGVFGVSSDEYLIYAQKNRQEWETRGQEIVATMLKKVSTTTNNSSATHEDTDSQESL